MSYPQKYIKRRVRKNGTVSFDNSIWAGQGDKLLPYARQQVVIKTGSLGFNAEAVRFERGTLIIIAELYAVKSGARK